MTLSNRAAVTSVDYKDRIAVEFDEATRPFTREFAPFWIPFINTKYQGPRDAMQRAPIGYTIPANGSTRIPIIIPRAANFLLLDVKYTAYRAAGNPSGDIIGGHRIGDADFGGGSAFVFRGAGNTQDYTKTVFEGMQMVIAHPTTGELSSHRVTSVVAANEFLITPVAPGAGPYTQVPVYARSLMKWSRVESQLRVSLLAKSPAARWMYGGEFQASALVDGTTTFQKLFQKHREPVQSLQGSNDGKAQLRTAYLFPKDGTIDIEIENPTSETLRVNGTIFGYKVYNKGVAP